MQFGGQHRFFSDFAQGDDGILVPVAVHGQLCAARNFPRALGGEQLVFSNTDLTNSRVHNFKKMDKRRIVFKLGVTYQTSAEKLKRIPQLVKDIIVAQEDAEFDRGHFAAYGDFSLNFEFVYYVHSADYAKYMDIQQAINLEIYKRFAEEGIEFPPLPILPEEIYEAGVLDLKDVIAPHALKVSPRELDLGEKIARTFFVISYPRFLTTGWFAPIINIDKVLDISIFIHPTDTNEKSRRSAEPDIHARTEGHGARPDAGHRLCGP